MVLGAMVSVLAVDAWAIPVNSTSKLRVEFDLSDTYPFTAFDHLDYLRYTLVAVNDDALHVNLTWNVSAFSDTGVLLGSSQLAWPPIIGLPFFGFDAGVTFESSTAKGFVIFDTFGEPLEITSISLRGGVSIPNALVEGEPELGVLELLPVSEPTSLVFLTLGVAALLGLRLRSCRHVGRASDTLRRARRA